MRAQPKRKKTHFWLDLFACFLIPGYTLLFAGSVTWFGTNFSVLAVTGEGHYRGFVLWGVLAGGYFLVVLTGLALSLEGRWAGHGVRLITLLACLCLGYALMIPYLPRHFPGYARLHVALAAGACALMMGALLLVLLSWRRHGRRCARLLWAWWAIVGGCAVLFALAGMVSSALEVFFSISAAHLARAMWNDENNSR